MTTISSPPVFATVIAWEKRHNHELVPPHATIGNAVKCFYVVSLRTSGIASPTLVRRRYEDFVDLHGAILHVFRTLLSEEPPPDADTKLAIASVLGSTKLVLPKKRLLTPQSILESRLAMLDLYLHDLFSSFSRPTLLRALDHPVARLFFRSNELDRRITLLESDEPPRLEIPKVPLLGDDGDAELEEEWMAEVEERRRWRSRVMDGDAAGALATLDRANSDAVIRARRVGDGSDGASPNRQRGAAAAAAATAAGGAMQQPLSRSASAKAAAASDRSDATAKKDSSTTAELSMPTSAVDETGKTPKRLAADSSKGAPSDPPSSSPPTTHPSAHPTSRTDSAMIREYAIAYAPLAPSPSPSPPPAKRPAQPTPAYAAPTQASAARRRKPLPTPPPPNTAAAKALVQARRRQPSAANVAMSNARTSSRTALVGPASAGETSATGMLLGSPTTSVAGMQASPIAQSPSQTVITSSPTTKMQPPQSPPSPSPSPPPTRISTKKSNRSTPTRSPSLKRSASTASKPRRPTRTPSRSPKRVQFSEDEAEVVGPVSPPPSATPSPKHEDKDPPVAAVVPGPSGSTPDFVVTDSPFTRPRTRRPGPAKQPKVLVMDGQFVAPSEPPTVPSRHSSIAPTAPTDQDEDEEDPNLLVAPPLSPGHSELPLASSAAENFWAPTAARKRVYGKVEVHDVEPESKGEDAGVPPPASRAPTAAEDNPDWDSALAYPTLTAAMEAASAPTARAPILSRAKAAMLSAWAAGLSPAPSTPDDVDDRMSPWQSDPGAGAASDDDGRSTSRSRSRSRSRRRRLSRVERWRLGAAFGAPEDGVAKRGRSRSRDRWGRRISEEVGEGGEGSVAQTAITGQIDVERIEAMRQRGGHLLEPSPRPSPQNTLTRSPSPSGSPLRVMTLDRKPPKDPKLSRHALALGKMLKPHSADDVKPAKKSLRNILLTALRRNKDTPTSAATNPEPPLAPPSPLHSAPVVASPPALPVAPHTVRFQPTAVDMAAIPPWNRTPAVVAGAVDPEAVLARKPSTLRRTRPVQPPPTPDDDPTTQGSISGPVDIQEWTPARPWNPPPHALSRKIGRALDRAGVEPAGVGVDVGRRGFRRRSRSFSGRWEWDRREEDDEEGGLVVGLGRGRSFDDLSMVSSAMTPRTAALAVVLRGAAEDGVEAGVPRVLTREARPAEVSVEKEDVAAVAVRRGATVHRAGTVGRNDTVSTLRRNDTIGALKRNDTIGALKRNDTVSTLKRTNTVESSVLGAGPLRELGRSATVGARLPAGRSYNSEDPSLRRDRIPHRTDSTNPVPDIVPRQPGVHPPRPSPHLYPNAVTPPRRSHTITAPTSTTELSTHFLQIKAYFGAEGQTLDPRAAIGGKWNRGLVAVKVARTIQFATLAKKLAAKAVKAGAVEVPEERRRDLDGKGVGIVIKGFLYVDAEGGRVMVADEEDWEACLMDVDGGKLTLMALYYFTD
ncbi:hypothetical protein HDU96_004402 [Phlyctochytrium bullatum]|nr:hypothetical protein HDU96_004402 [Phlyctochytrium bullatum]